MDNERISHLRHKIREYEGYIAQTITLIAEYHAEVDIFAMENARKKFLDYISDESGVSHDY